MKKKYWLAVFPVLLGAGLLSWYALQGRQVSEPALSDEPYQPRVITEQVTAMQAAMPEGQPRQAAQAGPLDEAALRLAARLAKAPDDVEGWLLLARTYRYLERPQEAREAMARARKYGYTEVGIGQSETDHEDIVTPSVSGRIELASKMAGKVRPDEVLFVYAKAEDGPQIPLASQRYRVADLPLDFSLDDGMAMMPTLKLSAYPRVRVFARISRSGQVRPGRGDLQGQSEIVNPAGSPRVRITIDTVL